MAKHLENFYAIAPTSLLYDINNDLTLFLLLVPSCLVNEIADCGIFFFFIGVVAYSVCILLLLLGFLS